MHYPNSTSRGAQAIRLKFNTSGSRLCGRQPGSKIHFDEKSPTRPEATRLRFNANPIVYCSANPLFAAEIAFGRLDRDVAKQELDLLQFALQRRGTTSHTSASGRGRNGPEAEFASVFLYHVPNQAFGHALAPTFVGPADAPE